MDKRRKPSNTRNKPISNELLCKLLIENQPQKVFCKDRNLTYVFCSRNYARDLNIQPEEVAGKTDFDFYPKELAEKYRADDERVMQAGKVEELEEKYIEDGQEKRVHTIKLPVKNENGDIAGIIGIFNDITESYIVKEKLSHLASFAELSPDPVMELDLSGNVQYLNPAAKRLFPELPEKGINHPYLAGWETLSTFLRDKEGIGFRREIKVNGAWYSQSVEYAPASKTIRIYGSDITERKQAEEALRASEEKFHNLIENAPVGISMARLHGRPVERNRASMEMHGYDSKEEFMRLRGSDLYYDPADRERFIELAARGPVKDFEVRHKRKDGSSFWVSQTSIQNTTESSEQQFIVIIQDITQRKQAEEELRKSREHLEDLVKERTAELEKINYDLNQEIAEHKKAEELLKASEERYRTLVDNIPVGVSVVTTDGQIIERNKAVMTMFGFKSKEESLASPAPAMYVNPDDRVRLLELLKRGPVNNFEVQRKRKDGTVFWASLASIPDPGDPKNRILTVIQDITEQKQAEELLARQARQLERANIELAAINKELESFSYSVSHDLRAPLRSIDGFSQILLEEYGNKLDDKSGGYLQRVRQASQRMGMLIDDLLSLSSVTRSEMHIADVDLSALAASIISELRSTQPYRQVDVIIEPGLKVNGDTNLLRIMLSNLLGNAWKFTGKHPQAKIEFGKTIREGKAVFFIRDDGAGFDMTYVDKLFNPFQRLHGTNEFEGTGIGLATVQRVINRHGGRVWAEGAVEKGATFYFTVQ